MRYSILRFTSFLFFLILSTTFLFSQNNKVTWSSFNMGFADVTSSNLKVKSVVGQVFVGTVRHENTQIISGFLADTLSRDLVLGVKQVDELPTEFSLEQNYPNPFNPITTIHFELPRATHVILKIYNILGEEVAALIDENKVAGKYDVQFDGARLPSGVYFYRLFCTDFSAVKKLILIK